MSSQKQFGRLGCCRSWRSVGNGRQLLLVYLSGRAGHNNLISQRQRKFQDENVPRAPAETICCCMESMCSFVLCSSYETRPFRLSSRSHNLVDNTSIRTRSKETPFSEWDGSQSMTGARDRMAMDGMWDIIYDMKVRCVCNSFTQSMNFEIDDRQRFIGRTLILNVHSIVEASDGRR